MVDSEDVKALREEIAKLRERVAVLETEAARSRPLVGGIDWLDWRGPMQIGTPAFPPRLVPMEPLPPGTIVCGGANHG